MEKAVKTSKPHSNLKLAVQIEITGNSLEFELISWKDTTAVFGYISLTTLTLHSNQTGINWSLFLYQNILSGFIKAIHNKMQVSIYLHWVTINSI